MPVPQQEPTIQGIFPKHHLLNLARRYPSMPMEERTEFSQTSFPMLPAARVQRHKTCSKTSALHRLSLYVTGEQQVNN